MGLQIIGPGFGRTGTNSMKLALEELGFGPCHHMFEVRDNPPLLQPWVEAGSGKAMDWASVFRDFRSQMDWPGARYWRELSAAFPDAKVVLTVRDPDRWFDSIEKTIAQFVAMRGKHETPHMNDIADMVVETLITPTFGPKGLTDRAHAIDVFNSHVDEVKAGIAPDRLLVFDVREGWQPLCAFLGVDVPDTPFPRTNSTRDFEATALNKA